ncbi:hypothetical protein SAMN05216262_105154 [Colwellia chukchiensis]|uniref:Uncharacterized protein n=1 Tax=Colwellia chukchiensis TaxID=641665 RepID=A0A1H7M9H6_9GAMM|nr:hypothetical protein SAMN05216262_105154 [Colwellia chukchiensis]
MLISHFTNRRDDNIVAALIKISALARLGGLVILSRCLGAASCQ